MKTEKPTIACHYYHNVLIRIQYYVNKCKSGDCHQIYICLTAGSLMSVVPLKILLFPLDDKYRYFSSRYYAQCCLYQTVLDKAEKTILFRLASTRPRLLIAKTN